MAEDEPLRGGEDMEPTRVPLKGPNVLSTFDLPPSPDAVKAHEAAMRKHLQDRHAPPQDQHDRHDPPDAA
jgi:hypothetical protein